MSFFQNREILSILEKTQTYNWSKKSTKTVPISSKFRVMDGFEYACLGIANLKEWVVDDYFIAAPRKRTAFPLKPV